MQIIKFESSRLHHNFWDDRNRAARKGRPAYFTGARRNKTHLIDELEQAKARPVCRVKFSVAPSTFSEKKPSVGRAERKGRIGHLSRRAVTCETCRVKPEFKRAGACLPLNNRKGRPATFTASTKIPLSKSGSGSDNPAGLNRGEMGASNFPA